MKTKKWILIGALAWAAPALAQQAGGIITAPGSDQGPGPTIVPVPSSLQHGNVGAIKLDGEIGAGKPDFSVRVEGSEEYHFGAVGGNPLPLLAGSRVREIEYQHTYMELDANPLVIQAGTTIPIPITKIVVPKLDGTYRFQVFHDLTVDSEAQLFYRHAPKVKLDDILSSVPYYVYALCSDYTSKFKEIPNTELGVRCAMIGRYYSEETAEFELRPEDAKVLFTPNDHGGYDLNQDTIKCEKGLFGPKIKSCSAQPLWESPPYRPRGFFFVTDPTDGEFVSVLPGTYGVLFSARYGQTTPETHDGLDETAPPVLGIQVQ